MIEPDCISLPSHYDNQSSAAPTKDQQQIFANSLQNSQQVNNQQVNSQQQAQQRRAPARPSYNLQNISPQQDNLISLSLNSHLLAAATPPALGSDASQTQFALSPEARACVTATYLCVLIVNSTWLDCNLLEMLCNSSQSTTASASSFGDPDDQRRRAREEYLAAMAETSSQLRAFESALEELVAFAGGGPGAKGGSFEPSATDYVAGAQKPATELLDDKGGGSHFYRAADELLGQLLLQNGQTGAGAAMSESSAAEDEAAEHYLSVLFANKLKSLADKKESPHASNRTAPELDSAATTQVPTTTSAVPSSSPASWLGRPFRGFSPFSFWSASSAGVSDLDSGRQDSPLPQQQLRQQQQQQQHQHQQQQQYQYLRPVESRQQPEQAYNDILANQNQNLSTWTGGHRGTPVIDQQRYQHQHNSNNNAALFTNLINSSADSQQATQLYPPFRGAPQLADRDLQQQHLRRPQQPAVQQDGELLCKCNDLDLVASPSFGGECRFRCQQHLRENAAQNQAQEPGGQLITATTFVAPSATLGPSAKMSPIDVTFLLYTRASATTSQQPLELSAPQALTIEQLALYPFHPTPATNDTNQAADSSVVPPFAGFNNSIPVKIVIHGFGSGGRKPWVSDMVLKLLEHEDAHVIVVDWEKGAAMPNYVQAAGNTRLVGHKIATLIKSINAKFGLTGNNYHLIGFSLGAHVAGFAGMEIRNSSSSARFWINRITGLDPASPLFEGYEVNDRLDPSDAQFVDVIHSNGDGVLRGGFGSLQPMGHVDFYPNGGRVQVGCNSVLLSALSDIIYGKWQSLCNHRRALNFFMDSFESKNNNCRFRSFNCDSYESYLKGECFDCGPNNEKCSTMGYMASLSKGRGKMYLTTHEEAPFCANQFTIKILGTKGFRSHWGKVEVTLVSADGKNESFWLSSMSQQSSGHELMQGGLAKDSSSQQQHSMQSLIVAHTSLANFTQVLLRYTKYKGWIYSGDESWPIDKVLITDSEGQVKSFCGFSTVLESHITSRLQLDEGNCTVQFQPEPGRETPAASTQQQPLVPTPATTNQRPQVGAIQTLPVAQQQIVANQHSARTPRLFAAKDNQQRMAERQQFLPLFNIVPPNIQHAHMLAAF